MKKPTIVLTLNGENTGNLDKSTTGIVFPALALRKNVEETVESPGFGREKYLINNFVPIYFEGSREKVEVTQANFMKREEKKLACVKQEQNSSYRDHNERVESQRNASKPTKRKNKKNKTDFQIKNVLQQISSSIQSCVKDGYVYSLTDQYLRNLQKQGKEERVAQYKKNMSKMTFLLENPTEYNFGCLLKMGDQIHNGLEFIFRSRILKKYIQCSKIRTLKQKSICLEAVDYLFRCFKELQICSLHTWAHKRDQKLENKLQRLKIACQKKTPCTNPPTAAPNLSTNIIINSASTTNQNDQLTTTSNLNMNMNMGNKGLNMGLGMGQGMGLGMNLNLSLSLNGSFIVSGGSGIGNESTRGSANGNVKLEE